MSLINTSRWNSIKVYSLFIELYNINLKKKQTNKIIEK